MARAVLMSHAITEMFKKGFDEQDDRYLVALMGTTYRVYPSNTNLLYQTTSKHEITHALYPKGGKPVSVEITEPSDLLAGVVFEMTVGSVSFDRDDTFPEMTYAILYQEKQHRVLAQMEVDKIKDFFKGSTQFSISFDEFIRLTQQV